MMNAGERTNHGLHRTDNRHITGIRAIASMAGGKAKPFEWTAAVRMSFYCRLAKKESIDFSKTPSVPLGEPSRCIRQGER